MQKTDGVVQADSGMRRVRRSRISFGVTRLFIPRRQITFGCFPGAAAKRQSSGLTLIELIAVIAIIGVLAAITFGLARGVRDRAAIGKARVEIAAIAQALESYRVRYGDYPQTSNAATMLQCLIGKLGPNGVALTDKPVIEMGRFSTANNADPFTTVTAVLADPFGKSYNYAYKTGGSWKNPSFVLFSPGPDGAVEGSLPADGFLTSAFETAFDSASRAGNPDNIYHGRN
jgi:prepilin-type N-terminal cleavage/methylation domain-containing protein